MTTYTAQTLDVSLSRNPMTAFALAAEIGDTFDGITCTGIAIVGPTANPAAFRRVTFTGYGETWTSDYPNRTGA